MYRKTREEGFGDEAKRRIMLGTYALSSGYYDAYYAQAQKVRTRIIEDFRAAYARYDVLVSPTAPTVAFGIGEKIDDPLAMYYQDLCTIPVNLAGIPAISIPGGLSDGLPVGVQLMSDHFTEGMLLRAARAAEKAAELRARVRASKALLGRDGGVDGRAAPGEGRTARDTEPSRGAGRDAGCSGPRTAPRSYGFQVLCRRRFSPLPSTRAAQ